MTLPLGRKVDFGFGLILLVLTIIGAVAVQSFTMMMASQRGIEVTVGIIFRVDHLQQTMAEAESAVRGYLLTGNRRYLEPYPGLEAQMIGHLDALATLAAGDDARVRLVDELRTATRLLLQRLDEASAVTGKEGSPPARPALWTELERQAMDRVHAVLVQLDDAESARLLQSRQEIRSRQQAAILAIIVSSVAAFLLVAIVRSPVHADLRAREAAERALAASEARLRELGADLERRVVARTAELSDANLKLRRRTEEVDLFLFTLTHDIRGPLINLQGFGKELDTTCLAVMDLLERPGPFGDAARRQCVEMIHRAHTGALPFVIAAGMRLSSDVDGLLALGRADGLPFQPAPVDVAAVVARIEASLHRAVVESAAKVVVSELPWAWGDPAAIEQVFAVLVQNALDYRQPARPCELSISGTVEAPPPAAALAGPSAEPARVGLVAGSGSEATPSAMRPWVTYRVRDNGRGVPARSLGKLFVAFQRLHPDVRPGRGIGLALAKRLVERHGGSIWAESVEGQGSTFCVCLPACPPEQRAEPATRAV